MSTGLKKPRGGRRDTAAKSRNAHLCRTQLLRGKHLNEPSKVMCRAAVHGARNAQPATRRLNPPQRLPARAGRGGEGRAYQAFPPDVRTRRYKECLISRQHGRPFRLRRTRHGISRMAPTGVAPSHLGTAQYCIAVTTAMGRSTSSRARVIRPDDAPFQGSLSARGSRTSRRDVGKRDPYAALMTMRVDSSRRS
jgi:hypothetical protein